MKKKSDRGLIFLQFIRLSCHSNAYCYLWCRWEKLLPMVSFLLPLVLLPLVQFSNQKQEFFPMVHSCLWCCKNETENTLGNQYLFWHLLWDGKSHFDIQNPILTFAMSRKILFWHSLRFGKSYFDIQYPILTNAMSRKILFWHSKSYFDILYDTENPIWHLKSYLTFAQSKKNPILTFDPLQKILFWHSKSYFDIRYEPKNPILTFKILFWHCEWQKKDFKCQNWIFRLIANVKIGFWMSQLDFPTHSECQNRIFNVKIAFSYP